MQVRAITVEHQEDDKFKVTVQRNILNLNNLEATIGIYDLASIFKLESTAIWVKGPEKICRMVYETYCKELVDNHSCQIFIYCNDEKVEKENVQFWQQEVWNWIGNAKDVASVGVFENMFGTGSPHSDIYSLLTNKMPSFSVFCPGMEYNLQDFKKLIEDTNMKNIKWWQCPLYVQRDSEIGRELHNICKNATTLKNCGVLMVDQFFVHMPKSSHRLVLGDIFLATKLILGLVSLFFLPIRPIPIVIIVAILAFTMLSVLDYLADFKTKITVKNT